MSISKAESGAHSDSRHGRGPAEGIIGHTYLLVQAEIKIIFIDRLARQRGPGANPQLRRIWKHKSNLLLEKSIRNQAGILQNPVCWSRVPISVVFKSIMALRTTQQSGSRTSTGGGVTKRKEKDGKGPSTCRSQGLPEKGYRGAVRRATLALLWSG